MEKDVEMFRMPRPFFLALLMLCTTFWVALSSCSQKVFVLHHPDSVFQTPNKPNKPSKDVAIVNPQVFVNQFVANSLPAERRKLIVIDPGHGGKDFGAEAVFHPPLKEKNLNLVTARFLEGYLQQMGYQTVMTRTDDYFISLDKRASFANSMQADLFVSVHFNSAPNAKADGIEIFYYRSDNNKERSFASNRLAGSILKFVIPNTQAKSRGVKHGNLAVIRKTGMPAALVEGGFITSEQELAKLRDPNYLKALAWGIAQGVQAYLEGGRG